MSSWGASTARDVPAIASSGPVVGVAVSPAAEQCRADAHFGGAFLDGEFEVAAHSHGKAVQFDAVYAFIARAVAAFPQGPEAGAHSSVVLLVDRQRHQAT